MPTVIVRMREAMGVDAPVMDTPGPKGPLVSRRLTWMAPLVLLFLLLAVWALASSSQGPMSFSLPSPGAVTKRSIVIMQESWFWSRVGLTLTESILGSFFGCVVALPTSWLIHKFRLINAALQPFLGATQAIPAIALAPLLVLWVGYGLGGIVVLCALMVFFPILVSTTVGLRRLDPDVIEAASLDGASGFRLIFSIEVPLVLPSLLAGVRNGFTLSITGAVVGEMVMGGAGLGQLLVQQQHNFDTAGMFVTVLFLCVLAMCLYSLVYFGETKGRSALGLERGRKKRS